MRHFSAHAHRHCLTPYLRVSPPNTSGTFLNGVMVAQIVGYKGNKPKAE